MRAPHAARTRWGTWLALGFSAVMLLLTFGKPHLHDSPHLTWRFDPRELWAVLRGHPLAFALVALFEAIQLPVRAWLWKYVLPRGVSKQGERYHAIALGALAQNILPARAGELVRALSLSKSCKELGRTRSLTTVATSKIAELAGLFTFIALVPLSLDIHSPELATFRRGAYVGAAILVGLVLLAYVLTHARGRTHRLEAALRHLPGALGRKLATGIEELAHGAAACGSAKRVLLAYLVGVVTVGLAIAAFMAGLWGVGAPVSLAAGTVVLAAVSLGMSIPSSPSGVGVFHIVCLYALTSLGVDGARAAAFALAVHLVGTLVNISLGLVALARGHESLASLTEREQPGRLEPQLLG